MPRPLAGALVFFASAAVLVLEILASRLLAPYVGDTLETYTGIIGVVLAGISVGTWLGGRLADRVDPRRLLGPIVLVGGVFALLTIPAVRIFGSVGLGAGPVAVVVLSAVGFFIPAAVLSAVTPTVVKLQLSTVAETGQVVGRLSGLGTAGAILGTFVTGFLLVAALPTTVIILGLGGVLVASGVALWALLRPQGQRFPAAMVVAGLAAAGLTGFLGTPCEYESAYFCARVETPEPQANPSERLLYLDRLRHSYVDIADPTQLEFDYAKVVGDVLATVEPKGQPVDALHIGGGGFTLPRYINARRPGSDNLVLEIDPTLVRIAEQELGLERGPNLRVRVGDARLGLRRQDANSYDVVIGDAFGGLAVPWHLTTRQFVDQIARTLRPDGVYVINLIDYPPLAFARAEAATLRAVFDHVAVLAPSAELAGQRGGNYVLAASNQPLPTEAILARNQRRGDDEAIATGQALSDFIDGAMVLTDNYAPVDQLLTPR